jgi:hypothetical protein
MAGTASMYDLPNTPAHHFPNEIKGPTGTSQNSSPKYKSPNSSARPWMIPKNMVFNFGGPHQHKFRAPVEVVWNLNIEYWFFNQACRAMYDISMCYLHATRNSSPGIMKLATRILPREVLYETFRIATIFRIEREVIGKDCPRHEAGATGSYSIVRLCLQWPDRKEILSFLKWFFDRYWREAQRSGLDDLFLRSWFPFGCRDGIYSCKCVD